MYHKIHFSRERCNGCKICEYICSISHNSLSKIKIIGFGENFDALLCTQCEERKCVKVCNNGALFIDNYTGTPTLSTNLCNKCMKCVLVCESSGLHYDTIQEKIIVCDTCNQRFLCIKLCPQHALSKIILQKHVLYKSF
ncbi:MAG: hypothetical protein N3F64_06335 [Nitrososphaeria archaeon]|nr:hypothetical protein [Nitrososphaeria archaeon]